MNVLLNLIRTKTLLRNFMEVKVLLERRLSWRLKFLETINIMDLET